MKKNNFGSEKRAFGRRRTCVHGFILAPGRAPTPCVVRNISVQGALLELDHPERLPSYFTLTIEIDRFSAECEIRHKTAHGAGVFFNAISIGQGGVDSRFVNRTGHALGSTTAA